MHIRATKKLLDQLKLKPADLKPQEEEDDFYSWHANLVTLNRRKAVILMNDATRYIVVLWGIKAKDFQKIDYWITESIRQTLLFDGLNPEFVQEYLEKSGPVTFGKTKNRSMIAKLNKAVDVVYFWQEFMEKDSVIQAAVGVKSSHRPVNDESGKFMEPVQMLYKEFEKQFGRPTFQCEVAELEVTLHLEGEDAVRQLIVPLSRTFYDLHRILQKAFGWKNTHLHRFLLEGGNGLPDVELVNSEEDFAYAEEGEQMRWDFQAKLKDYLSHYPFFIYNYDYGDDWLHSVKVKEIRMEEEYNHPVCLKIEGRTPPEDVGGSGGYEEFLKISQDSSHPDYKGLQAWAEMQGYREQDLRWVNRMLQDL